MEIFWKGSAGQINIDWLKANENYFNSEARLKRRATAVPNSIHKL